MQKMTVDQDSGNTGASYDRTIERSTGVRGRWFSFGRVILAAAMALASDESVAQPSLVRHEVGFGISVSLPASWVVDAPATLSAIRERTLQGMRESDRAELREIAGDAQDALVFAANDPARRTNSINMNVTLSPDMSANSVATSSAEERALTVSEVCGGMTKRLRELKGSGGCIRHEVQTVAGRQSLVIYQRVTIPSASLDYIRTVALVPGLGSLLTVGISLQAAENDEALPRVVLASLRFVDSKP